MARARATHTCPKEDRETATDYGASWRWRAARMSLVSLRSTPNQNAGWAHAERVCTGRNGSAASPPLRRRVVACTGEEQVEQKRAVDAVVPRARARAGAPRAPAPTCHMSHVTTKSCSWSRCSLPSVTYALAHVTSTLKLRGHAPPCGGATQRRISLRKALKKASLSHALRLAGVRDKVGPQCVTERSTHLLGNALE